jgi:RNA polymerase sigma-70 factor (ECF subfamily)
MTRDAVATRLYEAHARPLRIYAGRLLGDAGRGEDVVQEALLRAWLHADRLIDDDAAVRAWLYRVAHNIAVDEVRRRRTRPDEFLGATPAPAATTADASDRVALRIDLAQALARLKPEHRSVLVEIFYLDRTTVEAAESLRIPHGTAKSRLFYGLRQLKSLVPA